MIDEVHISNDDLISITEKYDDEKSVRALAYEIHTRFCNENKFKWRERINHLKWVRQKLNKMS